MEIKTIRHSFKRISHPFTFFAIVFFASFTTVQAGLFDDIAKDAKEDLKEAAENSKASISKEAKEIAEEASDSIKETARQTTASAKKAVKEAAKDKADNVKQRVHEQVNEAVNDVNVAIKKAVNTAASATVSMIKGNHNRIMNLKLEGIVVGYNVATAENTLTQAGYKKLTSDPWLFQKGKNVLKFIAKNDKIQSIELDGSAAASDDFIHQEKLRIETALGKSCPPPKQGGTWLCNLEGEGNEYYYLELKVRRNKYSYTVEGSI